MANKIETSSKNIKPRINLNHNTCLQVNFFSYCERSEIISSSTFKDNTDAAKSLFFP